MFRYRFRTFVLELVMIFTAVLFFIPIYVLINLSLKAPDDPSNPLTLATHPTLSNYGNAWTQAGLGSALVTSATITILSAAILIVVASMAAYPLARMTARWSKLAFYGFMFGLLVPFQLAMIPLYTTIKDLGLLGTVWGLILYYVGVQAPFSIFLYTGFLRAIPEEYEEAASIDGCGPFATFHRVVFPLLRPITGTVAILNVIFVWNDFLTPLLYLSGSGHQTVPVALFAFVGQYVSQWNLVFAGLIISIVPILAVYFALQKSVIQGFSGGLKG